MHRIQPYLLNILDEMRLSSENDIVKKDLKKILSCAMIWIHNKFPQLAQIKHITLFDRKTTHFPV